MTPDRESALESFARLEKAAGGRGSAWLRPLRQAALASFTRQGFPTPRDEDWRFTNVARIAETRFQSAPEGGAEPAPQALERFSALHGAGNRLVFVNGRYAGGLSSLRPLAAGVTVKSLAQARGAHRERMEPHLGRYADFEADAFAALNTAFFADGAFIEIPRGTVLSEPIHLLYLATAAPQPIMVHPRNLIVAGEESQATVVEEHLSLNGGIYFSNGITELVAGEGSVLSHYLVERESTKAYHVSTLRIQQARASNVAAHAVLVGGALVRHNVHPVLAGEGASSLINGLFLATGEQHMDNYMKVEHAGPHGDSRQFYHGILDGRSHGVFHGRVLVHPDAQKTDAKQTNRNLLLSEEAQIDTKPQLEIHADDVKCTHGATIGQVDDEAIFYLRSRGLASDAARALLLFAFASESLERMKLEPLRRHLTTLVTEWLPQGDLLEDLP